MKAANINDVAHIRTDYVQSQELYEKIKAKRRKGLIRRLIAFAVIFAIVASFMVSSILSQSNRLSGMAVQKEHLEKKLQSSKKDTKVLKQHIRLLHDKDYIGEIARRDYLLSKKGEIIFSKPDIDKH